jgi:predicted negative regulator of RcsB-dependent stress response
MDEDITIINANTRNEKIRVFFVKNKKILIIIISTIIILSIGYLSFDQAKKRNKSKLANQFNSIIIDYNNASEKGKIINDLSVLIKKKDKTYSPLALYFLIDNNLIKNKNEVNNLFNILIDKTNLELEIKNLLIYKKALYNSDFIKENELIKILNPIINSESIWKSHALYLIAEFFYSNNEREKAKEFFNQILILPNSNNSIKLESQKRLNRDLSE